ncbi:hypothetical protein TGAM01_v200957 [Trichoderma gamsii]|uniref:Uncharacterized protein n=1 Tax=Trichoderma gamsii TaxID=398673 RepID=A0A2P5A1W4_9HYPO|nr:hypothetical protein TGAM01_v200957 [Trichoderma gamsii]PON30517.1 hypothetical protein TGAM01_v200957 [Trichoderma gamsii]
MFPAAFNQPLRRSVTLQADSDRATTQPSSPPTIQPSVEGSESPPFCDDEIPRSIANHASSPGLYPLSRQVFNLERREREAQLNCTRLEEKCRELSLALERMREEKHDMEASYEARCQLVEARKTCVIKQLKKEKDKVKELCEKNDDLVMDLAAASEKNTYIEKMLEEKTHESYVFRCAYRVVFKCSLSIKEKCSISGVLKRVIERCQAERQRDIEAQADRDRDQKDEEAQPESSLFVSSSSVEAAAEAEDLSLGLSSPSSRRKRLLENHDEDQASSEDSDDDMPLLEIRRKRAKRFEDDIKVL